jgi:hypothetical protein
VANYTVESARYNTFVADITADQNNPRPIVAGGTGASDARSARIALGAATAMLTVTNYDTQVWENGFFWSGAGATTPPVTGRTFGGICIVINNDPNYITLIAHDISDAAVPGGHYIREKKAGVWTIWMPFNQAAIDLANTKVAKVGDIMSGNLSINTPAGPQLALNKTVNATANTIYGSSNGAARWSIDLGDAAPESSGNAGSNFYIRRWSDGGALMDLPLSINRTTGHAVFANNITSGAGGTTGTYYFGNSGTKALNYDGTNFNLVGGALMAGAGGMPANSGVINIGFMNSTGQYGISYRPNTDAAFPAVFWNAANGQVGYINTSSTATAYATSSDVRLKEDLKSFDAGRIIDETEVYNFKWKSTGERSYGVSAQQANEVYPQAVSYNERDDFWGIDYSKYVPVLLQELKTLRTRVAELEGRIAVKPA